MEIFRREINYAPSYWEMNGNQQYDDVEDLEATWKKEMEENCFQGFVMFVLEGRLESRRNCKNKGRYMREEGIRIGRELGEQEKICGERSL